MNDEANERKAETYEAMAVINRSFEQIMTALYTLQSKGVLGDDYPYQQEVVMRELSAKLNCHILASINERELDDRNHYSRMRASMERQSKSSKR